MYTYIYIYTYMYGVAWDRCGGRAPVGKGLQDLLGLSPSQEAGGLPHLLCAPRTFRRREGSALAPVVCSFLGVARLRVAPMSGLLWVSSGLGANPTLRALSCS